MGTSKVIKELKEFISFLQTLWGILAGVSILFPLSNVLLEVIPLGKWPDEGALMYLSPEQVTVITMLICLFVIFYLFSKRRYMKAEWNQEQEIELQKKSVHSFFLGILVLLIYFSLISLDYYGIFGWESDSSPFIFMDVMYLIFYSAFFGLITRAFVLLGMIEFLSEQMEGQ